MSQQPEIYIKQDGVRIDIRDGLWFMTDKWGIVWELRMTGDPDMPMRIVIVSKP